MGVTRAKQRTLVVSGPMLRGRHVYDDVRVRVRHSVRWRWVSVERLLTARSPAVARLGLKLRLSAESEARVLIARSPSVVTLGQFVRRSSVRPVSMGAPLVDSWPSAALRRKTLHVCATLKDGLAQPQGSAGPDRTDACAVVHKRMGSPAVVGAMHPRRDSATDTRSASARGVRPVPACAPAQFDRGSRGWLPAPLRRVRSIEHQDGALEMPALESSCVARCHVWHRCGHQNQGVSLSGRCRSAPSAAGP
jgi:hypothetical protein